MSSGLRLGWPASLLLAIVFLPSVLVASPLGDAARQLAHKIAAASGPGAFALAVTNRSSLDDKAVREVRSALEGQLQVEGVHATKAEQAIGTIDVVLSESLRECVWTAEIVTGSDEKKVVLVSSPRSQTATPLAATLPIVIKTALIYEQEQPMLDFALVDMPGGSRLIVLGDNAAAIFHRQGSTSGNSIGRWELEASLSIAHSRTFPRDLRGRLLLRRDHLFDAYLPGIFCRSNSSPLTLACNESGEPWPLAQDENSPRASYAAARNFFTGTLSPGIGKISNLPSFYSAAVLPRPSYALWAYAAVDGSLHLVDGMTDQAIRGAKWGSDLAAIHSGCGVGTQLLVSAGASLEPGNTERDSLRAFEIPDRELVAVSAAVEFSGKIVALWPESTGNGAAAIVKRNDTGSYEAYRVSISCGN